MDETTGTTSTGTQPPPGSGPRVTRDEVKDLGRLRRSVTDRHIAGVAGGLARHLDIDPIIVRVVLVVGVFFGGAGLLAYVGAWILVPEEGTDDEPLGLDRRNRAIALAVVGVVALLCAVGDWAGASWFPWPLAALAALVVWFLHRKERRGPTSGYGYDAPAATGPATGPTVEGDPTGAPPGATYDTPAVGWAPDDWGPRRREQAAAYVRTRPRNPRRRGPILFLFTLALIALGEGVLGVVDLAGVAVTPSAYPVLALGVTAAMLLLGSVWGRAGGLIALGLVTALVSAVVTLASAYPEERVSHVPTSASEVRDSYDLGGGELTLDLSDVADVEALDGRDVSIDGVGGRVEVVVPDEVDVTVRTQAAGGDSRVFGERRDGLDVNLDGFRDGGPGAPEMSITIDLFVGEIVVREAA